MVTMPNKPPPYLFPINEQKKIALSPQRENNTHTTETRKLLKDNQQIHIIPSNV